MEVLLVGNPNVGKSVVFNRLTGVGAISSNYSGTTVDYLKAEMLVNGKNVTFIDLPGIYSLTNGSEDQLVAAKMLHSANPDCVSSSRTPPSGAVPGAHLPAHRTGISHTRGHEHDGHRA